MAAVFDQKYLDDHDIIERYLANQLADAGGGLFIEMSSCPVDPAVRAAASRTA